MNLGQEASQLRQQPVLDLRGWNMVYNRYFLRILTSTTNLVGDYEGKVGGGLFHYYVQLTYFSGHPALQSPSWMKIRVLICIWTCPDQCLILRTPLPRKENVKIMVIKRVLIKGGRWRPFSRGCNRYVYDQEGEIVGSSLQLSFSPRQHKKICLPSSYHIVCSPTLSTTLLLFLPFAEDDIGQQFFCQTQNLDFFQRIYQDLEPQCQCHTSACVLLRQQVEKTFRISRNFCRNQEPKDFSTAREKFQFCVEVFTFSNDSLYDGR